MGSLASEKRELGCSKGQLNKWRKDGRIPAVVFGKTRKESVPLFVNWLQFNKMYHSTGKVFELEVDGKTELVNTKSVETDNLGKAVHISFHQLNRGEKVSVQVPVRVVGIAAGVKLGGIIQVTESEITVKGLPKDLPEHIDVDVASLEIHQHLTAGQIKLPKGLVLDQDASHNVIVCQAPQKEEEVEVVELHPEGEVAPVASDSDKLAS